MLSGLEWYNAMRYIMSSRKDSMIKSFKDREAEKIFNRRNSKKLPGDIQTAARKKLLMLDAATVPDELRTPPGNRFEALEGRPGFFSIRINVQWRVTFSWNDGAENVRIEDYH